MINNGTPIRNGLIIGAFIMFAIGAGKLIPTHEVVVTKTITKIVPKPVPNIIYKDREVVKDKIVYKDPDQWVAAQDTDQICKGSKPVEIVKIDINDNKDDNGKVKDQTTWTIVKPIGSSVLVTCNIAGNMKNFWKEGMIIMFKIGNSPL